MLASEHASNLDLAFLKATATAFDGLGDALCFFLSDASCATTALDSQVQHVVLFCLAIIRDVIGSIQSSAQAYVSCKQTLRAGLGRRQAELQGP